MPTISQQELLAAQSSTWFNSFSFGDGRGNYGPAENIAILRGAHFDSNGPSSIKDLLILNKATADLANYLGFSDSNSFSSALLVERSNIFKRPIAASLGTSSYPFPVTVQGGEKQQLSDKPSGESEGITGPPVVSPPYLFDTGYVYNNKVNPGTGSDFGNLGGAFKGNH